VGEWQKAKGIRTITAPLVYNTRRKKVSMIRLKLKEVLQEKKISQSKLSRMADVSLNTVQAMYQNPFHDAVLSTLERLAKALQVDVCDLSEVVPDKEYQSIKEENHVAPSFVQCSADTSVSGACNDSADESCQ